MPGNILHAFDPRSIQGCVCWLRADQGVQMSGGVVKRWKDRSGLGNDAFDPSTLGPSYVTGQMGQPALLFSPAGAGDVLVWNLALGGPKTVVVVFRIVADLSNTLYSLWTIGNAGPVAGGTLFAEYIDTLAVSTYANQTFLHEMVPPTVYPSTFGIGSDLGMTSGHMLINTYDGSGVTVSAGYGVAVDGADQAIVTSGALGRQATSLSSIGARFDGSSTALPSSIELYEVIVYNRNVNFQQRRDLYGYGRARYNAMF